jgi:hypothetical protein
MSSKLSSRGMDSQDGVQVNSQTSPRRQEPSNSLKQSTRSYPSITDRGTLARQIQPLCPLHPENMALPRRRQALLFRRVDPHPFPDPVQVREYGPEKRTFPRFSIRRAPASATSSGSSNRGRVELTLIPQAPATLYHPLADRSDLRTLVNLFDSPTSRKRGGGIPVTDVPWASHEDHAKR